ncbi:hypothetical protein SISNIDRAFT_494043 [Sistotremastrum niveocremeum HHB9708]|uniref:Mid2 domain-containing protein n=1 Tax=Sistotremastrum niveocremeum HHB9708 TaxID=1314777 RepID=A0A164X8T0_9AGAM|nr:hypothetical protein SISNIDRAFT_494043 [Sistotremastrum niveocremeum HHB9708]
MVPRVSLILTLSLFIFTLFLVPVSATNNIGQHARMIKKRATAPPDSSSPSGVLPIGVAPDPAAPSPATTPPVAATSPAAATPPADKSTPISEPATSPATSIPSTPIPSAPSTTPPVSTDTPGLIGGLTSALLGTGSSSASTTATNTTSTSSTSSSSSSTSSSAPASTTTTTPPASNTQSSSSSFSQAEVTVTSSVDGITDPTTSAQAQAEAAAAQSSTKLSKNTIIAIIVIASCVGGAALIWTVIRKWKLGTSSDFDARLNPIDWQPTTGLDGPEMVQHRRGPSGGSNRSFGSADAHMNSSTTGLTRGQTQRSTHSAGSPGGYDNSNSLIPDLPSHDFTAGSAHLAPIGGYADLARGGMDSGSNGLARGPSYNRGAYDGVSPGTAAAAYDYNGSYNRGY